MTYFISILIALIGAAVLGFICAWYFQKQKLELLQLERLELSSELKEKEEQAHQLIAEKETQQLSIENLQKQLQSIENEMFGLETSIKVMEGEMQVLEREKAKLQTENAQLEEELKNNINEIQLIREIPPLEKNKNGAEAPTDKEQEIRIESARKLVQAFQMGVEENVGSSAGE
ncbi:MAG TPA: hypothetical protein ENJ95_13200 [Bacteroidetes bacterium]|nr:hypothetical protein [Bacteroidota bacterium]